MLSAGVGGLADEALQLGQQGADFVQAAFRGAQHVAGAAGVVDGLGDPRLFGAEVFAGDQAGGIVGAGVDLQTGAEPLQARIKTVIVLRMTR